MYGQKQILQCLAVAIVLAVFNFHRSVIKRSKSIPRPKIRQSGEIRSKIHQIENDHIAWLNHNLTGYCIRYPFGKNIYGNHDIDYMCNSNCFHQFNMWLHQQCRANCCVHKSHIYNDHSKSMQKLMENQTISQLNKTRNCKNTFIEYIVCSADLNTHRFERVKPIIKSVNEYLIINRKCNEQIKPLECKIQKDDEFICKNTTSDSSQLAKLETNYTQTIMEYNNFLFDSGISKSETSTRVSGM